MGVWSLKVDWPQWLAFCLILVTLQKQQCPQCHKTPFSAQPPSEPSIRPFGWYAPTLPCLLTRVIAHYCIPACLWSLLCNLIDVVIFLCIYCSVLYVIPCTLNFTEKKFRDIFQNSKMQSTFSSSCPSCTQAAVKGIVHLTVLISPLVRVHVPQLLIAPILF